jgi:hypothetical protein
MELPGAAVGQRQSGFFAELFQAYRKERFTISLESASSKSSTIYRQSGTGASEATRPGAKAASFSKKILQCASAFLPSPAA